MTFKLDYDSLAQLSTILAEPSLQEYILKEEREEHARGLRGDVTANWLDSFMNRMHGASSDGSPEHLTNAATGQIHTVESMVAQYHDLVGLDAIQKSASMDIPLSRKQVLAKTEHGIVDIPEKKKDDKLNEEKEDILLNDMFNAISDHLGSHRGYADTQAIIYDLRTTFGEDAVNQFRDRLDEEIEKGKSQYVNDDPRGSLPHAPQGQPLKVEYGPSDDDVLFKNIRDQGGPNAR